MKVNLKSFVGGVIVGSVLFSSVALAAPGVVKMIVNGSEITSDVPAQIIEGRTLIPARALAEALGANVIWDEKSQTVTIEDEKYRRSQLKESALSEQLVAGLAGDAQRHYYVVANGGEGDRDDKALGNDYANYRWMASDLNTKAKLIEYLELLFTSEQVQAYYKELTDSKAIVEIDGKLAQLNADGGSLLEWSNATVKLVQDGKTAKTYKFTVPMGDEFEEKEIKLQLVPDKGWRFNVPVHTIH